LYYSAFANHQHNSFCPSDHISDGTLIWSKSYTEIMKTKEPLNAHLLLGSTEHLLIKGDWFLSICDYNGILLNEIEIGRNSSLYSAYLSNSEFQFFYGSELFNRIKHTGERVVNNEFITGRGDWTKVLLYAIINNDIIIANQFTGGPGRKPPEFFCCRQPFREFNWKWEYAGKGRLRAALLTNNENSLILVFDTKVVVIDCETGEITKDLPTEIKTVFSASIDFHDNILIIGRKSDKGQLHCALYCFNLSGNKMWEILLDNPHTNQPPICGNNGAVFVVDEQRLLRINNGVCLAVFNFPSKYPFVTTSQNNTVIVLDSFQLFAFDFDFNLLYNRVLLSPGESFECAPIISPAGMLFVAGDEKLYCLGKSQN
jgi:outer membrane protein assembly factor BamB